MNPKSRTRNSLINLTAALFNQGVTMIFKFISRTVFIYCLGKMYLGISGLFADILTMLSLTELGLDTAINFKLYKPLAEGDTEKTQIIMKFYKSAYRVVGLAVLLLGLLLIPFLPYLIKDYDTLAPLHINPELIFILYLINSVSTYLFFASRSAILKADQKDYITSITNTCVSVVSTIAQIVVLVLTKNFVLYVAVIVGAAILQNLINAIVATKMYPAVFRKTEKKLSFAEIKDIFKDLGALFVTRVNNVVLKATDNIVLSTFIGLAEVGLYSNYLLFYSAIKTLLLRVYNSIKAGAGNLFAKESEEKQYLFFQSMNFLCILLYGTAAVGIAVVINELIHYWIGDEYIIAQPFPILIGIEILFVGIKENLTQIRNVTGLFRQLWFRPVVGTIINLALSIILVQYIGIYGVIVGTIVADLTSNFLVDPQIIYKNVFAECGDVRDYYLRNIRYFIELALLYGVDTLLGRYILSGFGWLSVIVHAVICALSVPGYFLFAYRKKPECRYLLDKMKTIKGGLFSRGRK
jgi:O-antigen/teichoic acid export membrane protein